MENQLQFAIAKRNLTTLAAVDVAADLTREIDVLLDAADAIAGQSVAIAVGSRGIASLELVVSIIISRLKQRNLKPLIIPAMGSHGGATREGQTNVLCNLGINSEKMGVEIHASMETEQLGETSDGIAIHFSKTALNADHLLICNRIKPHTHFTGSIQSGLQKMLTIGLGKATGAACYHSATHQVEFNKLIRESIEIISKHVSVLGGIALLENSHKEICKIKAVAFCEFADAEPKLLQQAEALVARLPLKNIDLLIIDEIGKEISGTGFDTNIVGRKYNDHVSDERDWCQTKFIHVRNLTDATAGNANGIGIAEFCTQNVVEQTNWKITTLNAMTASHPTAAMRPVVYENDREVIDTILKMLGNNAKIVQIKNTLELETLHVSESCIKEILHNEPNTNITPPCPVQFTKNGNLHDLTPPNSPSNTP